MAAFTFSIIGGSTTSRTLTYTGGDGQRIFQGWTNMVWNRMRRNASGTPAPPPTIDDFADYMAQKLKLQFNEWVSQNETVITPPVPPAISTST